MGVHRRWCVINLINLPVSRDGFVFSFFGNVFFKGERLQDAIEPLKG